MYLTLLIIVPARALVEERQKPSLQDGRLIQFLMGLNEAYLGVKSNILMMGPLPTVSHDYSLLMQDEKQRHVHVASHLSDAAFMVSNQKFNTAQRFNSPHKPAYN